MRRLIVCLAAAFTLAAQAQPMTLAVDATDLARRILRVEQTVAVAPGPLTLRYARYLPGGHGPYGRVEQLAGLVVTTDAGQRLPWQRQAADPFAFTLTVPDGVQRLTLRFAHLSPLNDAVDRVAVTPTLLGVQWEQVLLYPADQPAAAQRVRARLTLPPGWQAATALRPEGDGFAEVALDTLIDSPVFAGPLIHREPLDAPGTPHAVTLNLLADTPAALRATPAQWAAHRALVHQADALFGGQRPWRQYDFLLALSDTFGGMGLEHQESSENALRPDYFSDWPAAIRGRELLAHEYVHAWNGKAHRPADLVTPDYHAPMGTSLLWVYEGLTEYWGHVLAARAGLSTPEQARDRLAQRAAYYAAAPGHRWRNLQDTTLDPAIGPGHPHAWPEWQRDADYYVEGLLLWLEADATVRAASGGQRSLDDLARTFFGRPPLWRADGSPGPRPYTFDDIVAALNAVQPLDWADWLRSRLDRVGGPATPDALAMAGWRLAWADDESAFQAAERGWSGESGAERLADFTYSLGFALVASSGKLEQVLWEGPAFAAGLTPGATLLAINGVAATPARLNDALRANRHGAAPLVLLVREGERFRSLTLDVRSGPRHPRLERLPGSPDWLGAILRARPD